MNVWLTEIWRSWRASLRKPGFLLLAIGVLGLGVGASAAVFTLVDDVVLRPLPFAQSGRLVTMGMPLSGGAPIVSTHQYQHLRNLKGVVSTGLLDASASAENVSSGGVPQRAQVLQFDRHLLPTLGLQPVIGHNFTAQEDRPNGPPVAMISQGYWQRAWGGNADVIGKQLRVKGKAYTIVGVLPAPFQAFCTRFLGGGDIALPMALTPEGSTGTIGYLAIARLAPSTTSAVVQAQVRARMSQLYAAGTDPTSQFMRKQPFNVTGLATALHARSKATITLFAASALCVLLIAWVNLANLLFLRTLARHHDGAVRAALGATGLRRHLPAFAESALAGVLGGWLGVGLAAAGLSVFRHFVPPAWLGNGGLAISATTWWFALAVAIVGALLATVFGVWKSRRVDLGVELHEGGRSGLDPRMGFLGRALVVVQVALATVLLAGAGVFLHALVAASQTDPGFNPDGVLAVQLTPLKTQYPDANSILALGERLQRRLSALPGVVHADVSNALPSAQTFISFGFQAGNSQPFDTAWSGVDAGYFSTFGIPVIKGRAFTRMDTPGSEPVAIVNQAFARKHFVGAALGKTIQATNPRPVTRRVVGVVGDTRGDGPFQPAQPIMYVSWQQVAPAMLHGTMYLSVRVRGNPDAWRKSVQNVIAEIAPMQPIAHMDSVRDLVAASVSQVWLILLLVGVFAALALLLAAAGIYAVMAVTVASREHEFGVRTALGASPRRLMHLVLRGGAWQIVIGLAIGIIAAVLLSGTLQSLLAQIGRGSALDPWALVGVCVVLAIAGLLACLLPALRAGHVQPMHALRGE